MCIHYLVMGRTRPSGKLIEGKEWHGRGRESERKKEARGKNDHPQTHKPQAVHDICGVHPERK